jgi:hypothetical protein
MTNPLTLEIMTNAYYGLPLINTAMQVRYADKLKQPKKAITIVKQLEYLSEDDRITELGTQYLFWAVFCERKTKEQ